MLQEAVDYCVAVGGTDVDKPYALIWNGSTWKSVPVPAHRGTSSQLVAVSCPSASSCTAIGNSGGVSGVTLAEGWNGSTWTIESTPAPNGYSFPLAISCTAVTSCTSTGEYFPNDGGTTDNLAYQRTG